MMSDLGAHFPTLFEARQGHSLAPGNSHGVMSHPFDREHRQSDPLGNKTPHFVDLFLDAADIAQAKPVIGAGSN